MWIGEVCLALAGGWRQEGNPERAHQVMKGWLGEQFPQTSGILMLLPAGLGAEVFREWLEIIGPFHDDFESACKAAIEYIRSVRLEEFTTSAERREFLTRVLWFREVLFGLFQVHALDDAPWQAILMEVCEAYENQSIIDRILQNPNSIRAVEALVPVAIPEPRGWPLTSEQPNPYISVGLSVFFKKN